jgi:heme/copper-type cytochrome/quinol oxidase subunit 3
MFRALGYLWLMFAGLLTLFGVLGLLVSIQAHEPNETDHGGVVITAAVALLVSAAGLTIAVHVIRGRYGRAGAVWGVALTLLGVLATLVHLLAAWTSTPL